MTGSLDTCPTTEQPAIWTGDHILPEDRAICALPAGTLQVVIRESCGEDLPQLFVQ
jgi:hypothetical protein